MQNEMRIMRAGMEDIEEIYALYRSLIHMPYSTWDEEYPTLDIVKDDLSKNAVLIMRGEEGKILSGKKAKEDKCRKP